MKRNYYLVSLLLAAAAAFTACSDDNEITKPTDQPKAEEVAEVAQANTFNALNSIMRTLAGLDELPDNWDSAIYTPTEGVVTDEAAPEVRSVIAASVEGAEQYFRDLCPDLEEGSNTWSNDSVGTLKFTKVGTDQCYATIDVNLKQMPGLKQIRLVPANVIPANSKFDGTPYYHMGDIVQDKKGVYWICVRPSGGPLKKEYSYFVSFDKSQLKYKTQKQDIYVCGVDYNYITRKTADKASTSGTWNYATNLAEEKIAIAAMHTFAMIGAAYTGSKADKLEELSENVQNIYKVLKAAGYDFKKLMSISGSTINLAAAYGSYKSISSKYFQEKYIQPVITLTLNNDPDYPFQGKALEEVVSTYHYLGAESMGVYWAMPTLTAAHTQDVEIVTYKSLWDGNGTADNGFEGGYSVPYNVNDYTINLSKGKLDVSSTKWFKLGDSGYMLPLVMVQKRITDKGNASKEFTKVVSVGDFSAKGPDFYYKTISNVERAIVDKSCGNKGGKPSKTLTDIQE